MTGCFDFYRECFDRTNGVLTLPIDVSYNKVVKELKPHNSNSLFVQKIYFIESRRVACQKTPTAIIKN